MEAAIMKILNDNAYADPFSEEAVISGVFDSLGFCNAIWEIEHELSREFPDEDVKLLWHGTVGDLVDYAKRKA